MSLAVIGALLLDLLGKLWALVLRLPWQAWAVAAALAFVWYWGALQYDRGEAAAVARYEAREMKLQKRIADLKARSAVVTERIVTKVEWRTKTIRERGAVIVKEVPTYVPLDSCPLPAGWRVLHDAAAAGLLPDAAAIPLAAPVPAQVAAATVAANYAADKETASSYCGLIEWGAAHGWQVPADTLAACEIDMPPKPAAMPE